MTRAPLLFLIFLVGASANPLLYDNPEWRVVGGSDVEALGRFPYIISLRTSSDSHTCGGSLISKDWVVTAGHCVYGGNPNSSSIVAGLLLQLNPNSGTRSQVSKIIVHEKYDSYNITNDIALLKLVTPIEETDIISYIELEKQKIDIARDVTLVGWGRTSYPGNLPNPLQWLPLRTITHELCRLSWSPEVVVESQVCTYTQTGQGACHGDSGGPLVDESGETPILVGLVSWGAPCAVGAADVYTKVSAFVPWINEQTGLDL